MEKEIENLRVKDGPLIFPHEAQLLGMVREIVHVSLQIDLLHEGLIDDPEKHKYLFQLEFGRA